MTQYILYPCIFYKCILPVFICDLKLFFLSLLNNIFRHNCCNTYTVCFLFYIFFSIYCFCIVFSIFGCRFYCRTGTQWFSMHTAHIVAGCRVLTHSNSHLPQWPLWIVGQPLGYPPILCLGALHFVPLCSPPLDCGCPWCLG